jgi:hypothetical protein
MAEPDRGYQRNTGCMRFACWTTKATDTHWKYVILIAFPRQQWVTRTLSNVTLIRTLPVFF